MRKMWLALAAALAAASAAQAQDGTAYAMDLRGTNILFSFPPDEPLNQTLIGFPLDYQTFAMDFSSDGKTLYAINHMTPDNNGDGVPDSMEIGTIDLGTGAWTLNAAIATPVPFETGLSMDPTSETLYLSIGSTLYTIDPDSGATTLVGVYSGMTPGGANIGLVIDISFDNCGQLYAHDISNDALWTVDKETAEATFIGFHGLAANFAQGMDFDPTTNVLYAAVYVSGGTGRYGTFDLETGMVNEILDLIMFTDPEGGTVELEIAVQGTGKCEETCLADCDGNGSLNVLDFICFQGIFQDGDPNADCDENGSLNVLDFICFQGAFQEGCP